MGLKSESRSTRLGYLWWLIEPALHIAVYYLAFGVLLRHGDDDYIAFLLVGVVHWLWFSKSIMNASQSILVGRELILQLPLHTGIFPLAEIFRDLLKQLVVVAVLLLSLRLMGYLPSAFWLYYPVIFALQVLLTLPCAGLVAALTPYMPDLRVIVPACLQLGMFVSGVFFGRDLIPAEYQWLLHLNPAYLLLESYRDILIREQQPAWGMLGQMTLGLMLFSALVIVLFSRLNRHFARIIQD
ncbi:MAG: ABC transporter permease [Pseudomonas sp.]|uniref:ABC transporter permease n=1 Tax=Pseudomonas sp. TaxID=306 RepID=UPI00339797C1